MRKLWLIAVAVVLITGCVTVTDGDRLLNEQNAHIGSFILQSAEDPEIKQAGSDVKGNSEQLAKAIGAPETPAGQYTPAFSSQFREQAEEEHQSEIGIMDKIKGFLPGWAGTAAGFAIAGWTFFKKRVQDKKVLSLYSGIQDLKEVFTSDDSLGKRAADIVNTIMKNSAVAHNLYTEIKQDLNTFKKEGKISS